jgi:hypothetical protein
VQRNRFDDVVMREHLGAGLIGVANLAVGVDQRLVRGRDGRGGDFQIEAGT